ncbi:hypothetical protein [Microbacterium sp. 77mftsu3.1]|uniref:hypothetical protein n=1 Tax=Microbacterium sp. 77mftsu3.1 TaxID=1761802 RepID=UPI0003A20ED8|nr:hypothetical protein [Microbacterium sp. 77mftsu3.1]SDH56144.1 hypothetical protein SAMN04488590_3581 [Microbacterium sp. 77mftsu3.1]
MDPRHDEPGVIRRRRYPKKDTVRRYRRTNYVSMDTDVTLADLVSWVTANVHGVAHEEITVHYSTLRWEDDATEEEKDAWDAEQAAQAVRTEKWEREQLARLTEKYGAPPA